MVAKCIVALGLAGAVNAANAAIVYLGGPWFYADGSTITTNIPDGQVIVQNNNSFSFSCGTFGGSDCGIAPPTIWEDAVAGDVLVTGIMVSFDVMDDMIENYMFAFTGVDADTGDINLIADELKTCRSAPPPGMAGRGGSCSAALPRNGPEFRVIPDVPLPAAAWLFGSALIGLGLVKRKSAQA